VREVVEEVVDRWRARCGGGERLDGAAAGRTLDERPAEERASELRAGQTLAWEEGQAAPLSPASLPLVARRAGATDDVCPNSYLTVT
jgi:hypothetical protein